MIPRDLECSRSQSQSFSGLIWRTTERESNIKQERDLVKVVSEDGSSRSTCNGIKKKD